MSSTEPNRITSRDNPLLKELRKLAQEPGAYRKLGRVWLEGDHLCRAARDRRVRPALAVFAESSGWHRDSNGPMRQTGPW